jgi:hypothetical protein
MTRVYIVSDTAVLLLRAVRYGSLHLMSAAACLLKRHLENDMTQHQLTKEVEESVRWLLCGGAQGLAELACRSLEQVRCQWWL